MIHSESKVSNLERSNVIPLIIEHEYAMTPERTDTRRLQYEINVHQVIKIAELFMPSLLSRHNVTSSGHCKLKTACLPAHEDEFSTLDCVCRKWLALILADGLLHFDWVMLS